MQRCKGLFIFLVGLISFSLCTCTVTEDYLTECGVALGTTYSITYRVPSGAQDSLPAQIRQSIDLCLRNVNRSLSIYNNHSLISKLNNNQTQETDSLFNTVFTKAVEVNRLTQGAFDISAGALFDLWGFGLENRHTVTEQEVQLALQHIGMDKFRLDQNTLYKTDSSATLNMNAIAKGYTSDRVASVFDDAGITDYLVEIGGEIVCKGKNQKGREWAIGIDAPIDGNVSPGEELQGIIYLTDKALATSGNYRNFYVENGKKYAHTIDPLTGRPVEHQLLSATVITKDCMSADAYATAFMVMGLDKSKLFLQAHPELEISVYFVYQLNGLFRIFVSPSVSFK